MRGMHKAAAVVAVAGLALSACGNDKDDAKDSGSGSADVTKVAMVYIGVPGDAGWTKRHEDGAKAIEKEFGDKVEVKRFENIPEGPQSSKTFDQLGRDKYDLVFATSFGYGDPMLEAAKKYPDTIWMHATGYKTNKPNMGTYFGAAEEARYLSGIAAGKATKNGKLCYVAAFGIPEVVRGINAFELGAQSVRPDATTQVAWTSTWFDPDKEKTTAQDLLKTGCDVIAQHQDTPAPGEAAQEVGAKWVGYNDDQQRFAPDAWLTGPLWDWAPFYVDMTKAVMEGSATEKLESFDYQYYGHMKDGMVTLSPFGKSVDEATQKLIEDKADEIRSGTFAPFTGPIMDQEGAEKVAAGQEAPLSELLSMDYFVKGVVGEIPKEG